MTCVAKLPAVVIAAVMTTALSAAEPRLPIPDLRPLLIAAIDAPGGHAEGVLSGPLANALTERFGGTSPIRIDVTTERRYSQPGCRRLRIRIWQEGVLVPGATEPRRQTVEIGINYCRDGMPPRSLS